LVISLPRLLPLGRSGSFYDALLKRETDALLRRWARHLERRRCGHHRHGAPKLWRVSHRYPTGWGREKLAGFEEPEDPWAQVRLHNVVQRHGNSSVRGGISRLCYGSGWFFSCIARWLRHIFVVVERVSSGASVIDVLDRVLDKGIVIDAWVRVSLVGIDLITIEAHVVVASIATYLQYADTVEQMPVTPRPAVLRAA
jgi:gas vesicle structural protein